MGHLFEFKCPECDFRTTCSKGIDRGFTIEVQPMHCSKCHVVKNIQIGKYVRNNEGIIQLESVQGVCESCGTGEYLKEWDCNTCPNCGEIGILHRDTLISWD